MNVIEQLEAKILSSARNPQKKYNPINKTANYKLEYSPNLVKEGCSQTASCSASEVLDTKIPVSVEVH